MIGTLGSSEQGDRNLKYSPAMAGIKLIAVLLCVLQDISSTVVGFC
jgi:hypothetical protein